MLSQASAGGCYHVMSMRYVALAGGWQAGELRNLGISNRNRGLSGRKSGIQQAGKEADLCGCRRFKIDRKELQRQNDGNVSGPLLVVSCTNIFIWLGGISDCRHLFLLPQLCVLHGAGRRVGNGQLTTINGHYENDRVPLNANSGAKPTR